MAAPILFLSRDLMFSSRVTAAAKSLGLETIVRPRLTDGAADESTKLVLVDLGQSAGDVGETVASIRAAAPQAHIAAYGPHVQADLLESAAAAGCDEVLTNGQFNADMQRVLAKALEG